MEGHECRLKPFKSLSSNVCGPTAAPAGKSSIRSSLPHGTKCCGFAHAAGSGSGSVWLSPSPLGPLHRRPRTRSAISSAPAENPLKGRLFFACATERANWRQEASQ
ncbi:hypothetical protein PC118_g21157 [Phytophthora cactorum]|uniref:Uncharacterized protein n=1 Tax=Phytophthora cactorum TaxID=29920 RepID=A0A8T1F7L8_9STRA|nr:hypothetical protein PC118_g21157 [Phytophthora cactorum]